MVRLRKATALLACVPLAALALGPVPAEAANTVTSSDIVDETIQKADIGPNAVGSSEIAANAVGSSEIAGNAVGGSEIATGAVTNFEIAAGAVRASEILDGAVGSAEIATGAVGSSEIATDAVGSSEIATGAVGSDEIATDAVGAAEILAGAVGTSEIAADTIAAADIAADAVGASEIAADAVGTSEIADGAVDTADLSDSIQVETATTYSAAGSFQLLAADLTLAAGAGTSDAGDSSFLGAAMGNVLGANLTKTHNYVGGVIGHYSVTGTNASTYPVGAVLAGVGDGTTTADGAVVAYIDGDSGVTTAGAAFKVMSNNSTPGSGFDFGVDLQDAAHDSYRAVDEDFYLKAPMRLVRDVVVLVNDGAPTNGTTGANTAGPGSLYVDTTGAKLYINTGSKASPTWTVVGSQS